MSEVSNLMVSVDPDDLGTVHELSEWLHARRVGWLREITGEPNQWGGGKHPECEVWAGTLNHQDTGEVLAKVRELPWRQPNTVQVLLMEQHQYFFRLWMFRGGDLREFTPAQPAEDDGDFWADRDH